FCVNRKFRHFTYAAQLGVNCQPRRKTKSCVFRTTQKRLNAFRRKNSTCLGCRAPWTVIQLSVSMAVRGRQSLSFALGGRPTRSLSRALIFRCLVRFAAAEL